MISTMPAVALETVVSQAAMMLRTDTKYVLTGGEITRVLNEFGSSLQVLEIEGRRSFAYETQYFDTPEWRSYYDAAHNRRRRFKTRIRQYCDSQTSWFEVKTTGDRGVTRKDRILTAPADFLDDRKRSFASQVLNARLGIGEETELHPTVTTQYYRSTFLLPDGGRATLDSKLRLSEASTAVEVRDQVILETKSENGRTWLDHQLWWMGIRPRRISKYATGMILAHPELPANRWHQTIQLLNTEPIGGHLQCQPN